MNTQEMFTRAQELMAEFGLKLVGAVIVVLVGRWVAALVRTKLRGMMTKAKIEPTLVLFTTNMAYFGLLAFIILAALTLVGVQTTSFIAVLGAAGLAVGLALQGSLANFAAGVLLIVFRPLKVGDLVEAGGTKGVVEDIQIFTTTLCTPDNKEVIVPNAKLTSDVIVNYSAKDSRRVDLVVGVSYGADIDKVKAVLADVLAADERILPEPAPTIGLLEMADSSVNFAVRPWTTPAEYWNVYFDTNERIKKRLDSEGISIPFPQRDVHMYQHSS